MCTCSHHPLPHKLQPLLSSPQQKINSRHRNVASSRLHCTETPHPFRISLNESSGHQTVGAMSTATKSTSFTFEALTIHLSVAASTLTVASKPPRLQFSVFQENDIAVNQAHKTGDQAARDDIMPSTPVYAPAEATAYGAAIPMHAPPFAIPPVGAQGFRMVSAPGPRKTYSQRHHLS